ncbi:MAG: SusC/RagA family TonB-linked outer membrane protein [Chitinophagales bacterium]
MTTMLPFQKWTSIFLSFFLLLCCNFAQAQHTVKGNVTDSESGETIIGANIVIEGSSTGTITDIEGNYEIEAENSNQSLVFSYIGFESQTIPIAGRQSIEVALVPDTKQLGEVVVTALGIKRQKRELGYSTEKFDGAAITKSDAPNVVNALSGRSAGVQVISPNGVDGGTTRFVIRGNNNINANNQPLIVVDGVPLENQAGLEDIGRGVDWGSAINNINPADIADVNILKGPTASALYGARGANGVVIITTKRGKKQKGIGINYSVQHKIIQPYYYRDVQNVYGAGGPISLLEPKFEVDSEGVNLYPSTTHVNEGPFGKSTNELFGFYSTGVSWGPEMLGQPVRWWDGEIRSYDPQPDNLKQYFDEGSTTTHNISFSGGGEMGTMRVSLTRAEHEAIIPNSEYNQTTVNLGSRLNISSKVQADLSLSYFNYNRLNPPTLGDDNDKSFGKGILYSWPRSYKGLERELNTLPDGTRNDYGGSYPFTFTPPHLWWNTYHQSTTLDRNKLLGALTLNYEITPWLTAMGRVGLDFTLNEFEQRNDPIDALGIQDGFYSNELDRDFVTNNEFLLTANKENLFGSNFNASLSLGGTQWKRTRYGLKGESGEWVSPWLFSFNNYEDELNAPEISEIRYEKQINSVYGFLNLSYSNFLFLELTGRNDWSSALPTNNNSYFYPSASLSFIASEKLQGLPEWWSFWKIRGAYAQTASDTDPFQLDFVYNIGSFGGNQTATLPETIPPIELTPQQANSYEIGTTLGFFDDKVNLDFTYYHIRSYDQILDSPLPNSSGANNIRINRGELENKGFEAILNVQVLKTRDMFLETGINLSRNRNYVVSLGEDASILELANIWELNGPAIAVREGEEYGTIVGYDYVYHENGQPILNDAGTHYLISDSRVPIGNASPDLTGGWTMRLGYKGFTLSTLVDAKIGGDIYAGSYVIGLQTGQSPETLLERQGGGLPYTDPEGNVRNIGVILDGVYADGTPNEEIVHYYFKYVPNKGGWGHFLSSPGVLDNTWVKLREVSLSYDFPDRLLSKSKIFQDLSVSLVGRDLFYIYSSLPDRINPEGGNGAGNAQGLEWASYPGTRSVSLGVRVGF